jgi:hypothetical protein
MCDTAHNMGELAPGYCSNVGKDATDGKSE